MHFFRGAISRYGALLLLGLPDASMAASTAAANAPGMSTQTIVDVAAASQNPIADLASLPLQLNLQYGIGPDDGFSPLLNVQPVIPVRLTERLLLVTRAILPLLALPGPAAVSGMGDLSLSWFLSPPPIGPVTLGLGPQLVLPTASHPALGQGRLFVGASGVAVVTVGPVVAGTLLSQADSFPMNDAEELLRQSLIQPFISWNGADGWFLNSSPLLLASSVRAESPQWTVPLGGGAGRILRVFGITVSAQAGAYWNVIAPVGGPSWTLRASFALLFPTLTPGSRTSRTATRVPEAS